MRVIVATDERFVRIGGGTVYSLTGGAEYRRWASHLSVFDEVMVLARVKAARQEYPADSLASGPGVLFHDLPPNFGLVDYLSMGYRMRRRMAELKLDDSASILRVPGLVGTFFAGLLRNRDHPYGVRVVGNPFEVFAPGTIRHPMRPIFRFLLTRWLKEQCANASAAAYVTSSVLQKPYPPGPETFHTAYTDVNLSEQAFVEQARIYENMPARAMHLISVGTMAQMYKGFDVLIEALALSIKQGAKLSLTLVGDGRYRDTLRKQVEQLGVAEHVTFKGLLPAGEAVRAQLDKADLFVLASRTEGLPRALLEAMARGLPCVGTDVGGIPELLPQECMVPPDDAQALSEKLLELVARPHILTELSRRNLQKAHKFEDRLLETRRRQFYEHVRMTTEEWLQRNNRRG